MRWPSGFGNNHAAKDSVIVAASGYGQEEDYHRTKAAGFDYHLVKPIEFDALSSLIARAAIS